VIKNRIIRFDWHLWDRTAGAPPEYPDEGEPENYIWEEPHDKSTADDMPDAWELLIPVSNVTYQGDPDDDGPLLTVMENRDYPRWFRTRKEWGDVVVSPSVRDWLESRIPEWVRFERLHYKIA
jgi:ribosomal protein L39E